MRFALVNPLWTFAGSTYFGCREPHMPLELMFAAEDLRSRGHDAIVVDAHIDKLGFAQTKQRVDAFQPDFVVIPTAPTYLFWRCPQPELRVPMAWMQAMSPEAVKVIVGPHASATPAAAIRKTGCAVAIRGEPDQVLAELATRPWSEIAGCCFRNDEGIHVSSSLAVAEMQALPRLDFRGYHVEAHRHCHHVFTAPQGLGAELEFARGCPWACAFCNKTLFRNRFRERGVDAVLAEIDALSARGVTYVYFIDEVFGAGTNTRRLLEGIAQRRVKIGLQTRIDLWDEESLELLADAHCVSMECGIESITEAGREDLNKRCRIDTRRISELLIAARARIPWVQANLILTEKDDREHIHAWQGVLRARGVWVGEPVPMFPFPGSPLYARIFGAPPDDEAWERAHRYYTATFHGGDYSDVQDQKPAPIEDLENACLDHR